MTAAVDTAARPLRHQSFLIWFAAIAGGLAIHIALWPYSEPPWIFSDFYKAYWVAGEHLWNGGLGAGYPFTVKGNWSNLPILAWPFALLVPLGREAAGWTYLGIGICVTLAAWALLVRLSGLRGTMAALLLFLFLVNGPLLNSLREGNSTHFVLLIMIAGVWAWQEKHDFLAGFAFGICAAIKPLLALIGIYFLVRRRWGVVAGGATSIGIAVLLSLAVFGVQGNLLWYDEAVKPYLGHAVAAFNVQSIDGFLIRLSTGAGELLYWGPIEPSPLHKIARHVSFLVLLGGFGWLMWRAERARLISPQTGAGVTGHDLLQFSMVLILSMLLSPAAWTHYYLVFILPLGLYLGGRLPMPDDAVTRWLFWIGYVLSALPVVMPAMDPESELPRGLAAEIAARTLVSAWMFGAILMLAAFARGAWLASRSGENPAESARA
ncbi:MULTISPECIES: glycosyltransferase family 87 protein [Rhodomicrobium]|uniref:glycosyltransferase family 87 protein n=1 Tax=Rhodomicrobium TaxID=1068 RepID=UPI000B4B69BA|nr:MULTISPECIES: glycosyltransferase family 87 protein [Rhodomicrobium]